MILVILKKIGRFFIILTHEDRSIKSEEIKNILIVSISSEEHLNRAIKAISERFKFAEQKIAIPESKVAIVSDIVSAKYIFSIKQNTVLSKYSRQLKRFNADRFDAVIILSLNPYLVWNICKRFSCKKLLYNYCDEWYLIRRKTIVEFLCGRKGNDREEFDWYNLNGKKIFLKIMVNALKLPFKLVSVTIRLLYIWLYILINILSLSFRGIVGKRII